MVGVKVDVTATECQRLQGKTVHVRKDCKVLFVHACNINVHEMPVISEKETVTREWLSVNMKEFGLPPLDAPANAQNEHAYDVSESVPMVAKKR